MAALSSPPRSRNRAGRRDRPGERTLSRHSLARLRRAPLRRSVRCFVTPGTDATIWFAPPDTSILDEGCYLRTGRIFISDGEEMLEAMRTLASGRPVGSLARWAAKDAEK